MSASLSEPLWDLVEESLDEAAFLWKRWEAELTSPTRNLDDTWSWTEDRLHGALDGVRAAGASLQKRLAAQDALGSDDPWRLTICGHVLAAGSPREARELLGSAVREADEGRLAALLRGIETADLDGTFVPVASLLAAQGPLHSAALCRLKAFRRANPGREVPEAFSTGNPQYQVAALRAASVSADPEHRKLVTTALESDAPAVRLAAIQCGIRFGLPDAWRAAIALGQQLRPESASVLSLLAMLGGAGEHGIVMTALRRPELQRHALFALGYLGTPEAVETCIAGMENPELARIAGEAYCAITGADIERDNLAAPEPEDDAQPVPLEADDLDADLVPKAQDLWPLPDADAVRRHWREAASRFAAGSRHVRGQPVDVATLVRAVDTGPMLRRGDLLLELAARSGGKYDVEPRAFVRVQRRMMAASRGALPGSAPS